MGRHALRELSLSDVPGLLRRYAAEYQTKRPTAKKLGRFALSLLRWRRTKATAQPLAEVLTRQSPFALAIVALEPVKYFDRCG